MKKYSIGVDFGSLSGRAVLVDLTTGEEIAISTFDYPHAVMSEKLLDGTKLDMDFALQHPQDYLDVFSDTILKVIKDARIDPADVIGVGIDFTACTMLPVLEYGTPLCFLDGFKNRPHSYIKLWKHHAAQDEANKINKIAEDMGEIWLSRYGGKISSEWLFPKIWEILDENNVLKRLKEIKKGNI
jgi:L-ribulokinase